MVQMVETRIFDLKWGEGCLGQLVRAICSDARDNWKDNIGSCCCCFCCPCLDFLCLPEFHS